MKNLMKKIIAKWFNLTTREDLIDLYSRMKESQKDYYQKVVDEMARTGTMPPNCDLKLPKKSMTVLVMTDDDNINGEVIAKDGRWLRLPLDREKVVIRYI